MDQSNIRNFCIIAHIDHGKSTLADRLLEITGTVEKRKMKEQVLDQMDLERERGITIKLQPVRMMYHSANTKHEIRNSNQIPNSKSQIPKSLEFRNLDLEFASSVYELNLIDTPGHVDFSYEVSRSLAACEGAILVVDATQGIQAQTLANVNLALEHNLVIIPVVNKIDLPNAEPEQTGIEIKDTFGFADDEILFVSAKTGENVEQILQRVVQKIPPPKGEPSEPLQALIFDSKYDKHRGVVAYVRIVNGRVQTNDKLLMLATNLTAQAIEVGYFIPELKKAESLEVGEVGYIVTGAHEVRDVRVGDTITIQRQSASSQSARGGSALPGYKEVKPMVYASIFPKAGDDYPILRDAMEKLKLNDASLIYEPESIPALGFGFRTGFLGLLHMDIVSERLRREFSLELVFTSPSVAYNVKRSNGEEKVIYGPAELPDASEIASIAEPWVRLDVLSPEKYLGGIMSLVTGRRGVYKSTSYIGVGRINQHFEMPLANLISDFYDKLKSISSGYASMNYELLEFRSGELVRLDILVAGDKIDALSMIVHESVAESEGRRVVEKLKELIPKQQFAVALQATIGGKVIARETLPAMRKDVTAKLYGGDVTRKMKLLQKQKKGKKRLKAMGRVDIPQEAFLALMKK